MKKMSMNGRSPSYFMLKTLISKLIDLIAIRNFGEAKNNRTKALEYAVLFTVKNQLDTFKKALETNDEQKEDILKLMKDIDASKE